MIVSDVWISVSLYWGCTNIVTIWSGRVFSSQPLELSLEPKYFEASCDHKGRRSKVRRVNGVQLPNSLFLLACSVGRWESDRRTGQKGDPSYPLFICNIEGDSLDRRCYFQRPNGKTPTWDRYLVLVEAICTLGKELMLCWALVTTTTYCVWHYINHNSHIETSLPAFPLPMM